MKASDIKLFLIFVGLVVFAACKSHVKKQAAGDNPVFSDPKIKDITDKINGHPKEADLYFQRGEILHKMQQDTLALKDYEQAAMLDSTKAEYFSSVGDLLFDHKDIDGSIKWIKKAIALNPNDLKAHLKIAKLFLFIKDYKKTFDELNIVLKQNVYNPEAYWLKGLAYKNMKDTAKAISSFQTAVEVAPDYREAVIQLAQLYSAKKNPVALKYYDNAYRLDTTDAFPLFARGVYYQNINDIPQAKAEYRNCIVHDNQYADAYFNVGWLLMQEDSTDKAWRQFDFVAKVEPTNPMAYYNRGLCSEIMNKKMDAVNDYRQALIFDSAYAAPKDALKRLGYKK